MTVRKQSVYYLTPDQVEIIVFGKPTWCTVSERRLLTKMAVFKPVGINRNFHLMALRDALHYVHEDEEDTDFEELLTADDYKLYIERQRAVQKDVLIFRPKYLFRPTVKEIVEKIGQYYNIDVLAEYDSHRQKLSDHAVEFKFR